MSLFATLMISCHIACITYDKLRNIISWHFCWLSCIMCRIFGKIM